MTRRRRPLAAATMTILALALASLVGCGHAYNEGSAEWRPPRYWDQERYVELAGVRTCYLERGPLEASAASSGQPPTIVFVHGWSGNLQNWWDQYEYFKRRYRVVVFDLPGHGKSERGPHMKYTMRLFVRVLLELLDALEIERAIVAGNSAGGWIATRFALEHPDRVERLVLADPTGTRYRGTIGVVLPILSARRLHMVGMTSGVHYPATDAKSVARREFVESFNGTRELEPYLEALAEVLPQTYERLDERFADIEAPTLVLWGDNDRVIPMPARRLYARIPDVERYDVHLGGHAPMMGSPAETTCAIDAYLSGRALEPCERYAITRATARAYWSGKPVALPRYP